MHNCRIPFKRGMLVLFLHLSLLHAMATHAINFVDAAVFPQRCVGMSVRAR